MKLSRLSALLLSGLLLSACAAKPKSDYDVGYDFSQLSTFIEFSPTQTNDPISSARIIDAITDALTAKGFVRSIDHPSFKVTYAFKVENKPKDSGVSIGLGTGTWGSNGGISIGTSVGVPIGSDSAKIQTIQIDVIDTQSNKLIWRGTDKFNFDAGGAEKAEDTHNTVSKILSQFPPQKQTK
ncbi:DUF4136 domain-containing protein [Shewanella canadensis]|uniref:DUF4136 domain-containing protein n=1 Tax=Shewanella canadensis TaxID=271096 RepID=A0A3S0S0M8_9GAMM|nr:DUF4136 domain-containing protein [Shewanella canadensis]RTR40880.1 DUF4136 domain-containing protein [Shewanella canadensis]